MVIRRALAAFAATLILLYAAAVPASAVTVLIDGRALSFDQPPIMQGGRVLVPLRGIFENMGASVVYMPATRQITANRGGTVVQLTMNSRNALVNGRTVYLDVPPQSINGRTLVPLRFISEALGANVRWIPSSQTVVIQSTTPVTSIPPVNLPPVYQPPIGQQPVIDQVIISSGQFLRPGDLLTVIATGSPGGTASFDLQGNASGMSMRETASGRYEGSMTITQNMRANNAPVLVTLHRNGLSTTRQSSTTVTLATSGYPYTGQQPFPGQGGPIFVTVQYPQSGTTVRGNFNVTGQTVPYANVEVKATNQQAIIPGLINIKTNSVTARGVADANGYFNIPVSIGSGTSIIGGNTNSLQLSVRATDNAGNASEAQTFDVSVDN
jgi:hypothetical protein